MHTRFARSAAKLRRQTPRLCATAFAGEFSGGCDFSIKITSSHRASPPRFVMVELALLGKDEAEPALEFQQQALSEYHLYTLSQRVSLDAGTIGFRIPAEKGGSAALDYRVRAKW